MGDKKRIFVASSGDLSNERQSLKTLLYDEGFEPVLWEDIDHSITEDKFQDRINDDQLTTSDIVIFMVKSRLGKYTIEEFNVAYENLGKNIRKVYIYFFDIVANKDNKDEINKIWELQEFLEKGEKLYREVMDYKLLENHFLKQIKHINSEMETLKKTPLGVEEISEDKNEKLQYKKYLSNSELPYVSRIKFRNENLQDNSAFQTEKEYYESTFSDTNSYEGIFIYGEGGVGKTRLMYEIGREAQNKGWITYQIFPNFKGWDKLELDKNRKYCFLFDYVEENNHFTEDIIDILQREYSNIVIRIVANARYTYMLNNEVNNTLFNEINLNISLEEEHNYLKYVVLEIFKSKNIFLDIKQLEILEKYIGKPSFAVFLLQGILKDKTINFHDISEFSNFIKKRLVLTFKKTSFLDIEPKILHFLFSLPIKSTIDSDIMDELIIAPLEHDGWIEYNAELDTYKSAYNDTIMDEILIAYLDKQEFKREIKLKKELISMFNFSIKHSQFLYMFRALDRILDKSILSENENLLIDVFSEYISNIEEIVYTFAKASLLTNINKIKFFEAHKILKTTTTYSMTLVNAIRTIEFTDKDYGFLKQLSEKWINTHKDNISFPFVSSHYLEKADSIEAIQETIEKWINSHVEHERFDFVANRYLEKADSIEAIQETIEQWINSHVEHERFDFVASRYLEKADSIEATHETIEEWINSHSEHENFTFIADRYFRKTDSIKVIQCTIEEWLNSHVEDKRFHYVANGYLEKADSIKDTKKTIEEWINSHSEHENFTFITDRYLRKIDSIKDTKKTIEEWINSHVEHERFDFVASWYLEKADSIEATHETIEEWINSHVEHERFVFVIKSYLDKVNSIEVTQKTIEKWINNHVDHYHSDFVIKRYLILSKSILLVKFSIEEWINNNIDHESFSFVLAEFLKKADSIEATQKTIEEWINSHVNNKSFPYMIKRYMDKHNDVENMSHSIEKWLDMNHEDSQYSIILKLYAYKYEYSQSAKVYAAKWMERSGQKKIKL